MQFSLNSQEVKVVTQIQEHRHPGGTRYFSFTKSKQFANKHKLTLTQLPLTVFFLNQSFCNDKKHP